MCRFFTSFKPRKFARLSYVYNMTYAALTNILLGCLGLGMRQNLFTSIVTILTLNSSDEGSIVSQEKVLRFQLRDDYY